MKKSKQLRLVGVFILIVWIIWNVLIRPLVMIVAGIATFLFWLGLIIVVLLLISSVLYGRNGK